MVPWLSQPQLNANRLIDCQHVGIAEAINEALQTLLGDSTDLVSLCFMWLTL